jgi:hypothetical protein
MDSADHGFGTSESFATPEPNYRWGGRIASSKRVSLQANENLHYEGTYYLALKEFLDHDAAERIARANMEVDDPGKAIIWYFLRDADIPHHLASKDVDGIIVRREALEHYREMLRKACEALKTGNRQDADKFLGQALHTLQDSFSHSDEHGDPMHSEEHNSALDHPANNLIKAGLALQETEKVMQKYGKKIMETECFSLQSDCNTCTYWDSEVLFNMPRSEEASKKCTNRV